MLIAPGAGKDHKLQDATPNPKSDMARVEKQGIAIALLLTFSLAASVAWIAYENQKQESAPTSSTQQQGVSPLSAAPILR